MKQLLSYIVLLFPFWAFPQYDKFSLGIEYKLDEKSRTKWGDLSILTNYTIQTYSQENKPTELSIGMRYENQPGLLGDLGHVHVTFDMMHPDKKLHIPLQSLTADINTILNYNPAIIKKYEKSIHLFEALTKDKQKKIDSKKKFLKKMNPQKIADLRNKEVFLLQKKLFEASLYSSNSETIHDIKTIIKELEQEYVQ